MALRKVSNHVGRVRASQSKDDLANSVSNKSNNKIQPFYRSRLIVGI